MKMTLAVGVVTSGGVILGTDTLVVDGYTKSYRSKTRNLCHGRSDLKVVASMAGREDTAKIALDRIKDGLLNIDPGAETHRIRGLLEKEIRETKKKHVRQDDSKEFQLLVAVWRRCPAHSCELIAAG